MADELFTVDNKDLKKILKFFRQSPERFAKATGSMLNDFAFGTRNTSIEVINENMTVRNIRFVMSRMRTEKSHQRMPMESQQSTVGSITSPRFSGWKEQQTGQKTARERTITLLGRMRRKTRKLVRTARLKDVGRFESYHKYPGRGREQKNIIMMQKLDRQRWKKPFIISGKKGMVAGLYKFRRRKPRLLQVFEPKKLQPKRIPWMEDAIRRYFQRQDIHRLWARTLRRLIKPRL